MPAATLARLPSFFRSLAPVRQASRPLHDTHHPSSHYHPYTVLNSRLYLARLALAVTSTPIYQPRGCPSCALHRLARQEASPTHPPRSFVVVLLFCFRVCVCVFRRCRRRCCSSIRLIIDPSFSLSLCHPPEPLLACRYPFFLGPFSSLCAAKEKRFPAPVPLDPNFLPRELPGLKFKCLDSRCSFEAVFDLVTTSTDLRHAGSEFQRVRAQLHNLSALA